MSRAERVPTPEAALYRLDLPPDLPIVELSAPQLRSFRRLVGWDAGGPVVAYPIAAETRARASRQRWKAQRAGRGQAGPCLLFGPEQLDIFRFNVKNDPHTARWYRRFLSLAAETAQLAEEDIAGLVPAQGPWVTAGSYCPHCIGKKSDYAIHHPFWRWSPFDPGRIQCPHCNTVFPHRDYPEEGRLELPRLGITYRFYQSPQSMTKADWRRGWHTSSFGGAPTQVSLSGEAGRCALSWVLGQVQPLGLAYALTGERRYARLASAVLLRLAEVYARYPLYSYRQEYADAEPAYAVQRVDDLPTPFRRAAFEYAYTGRWRERHNLHGKDQTTTARVAYPNGEWGSSRLGREKSSNGELFFSLFQGYDLIKQSLTGDQRHRIEQDFLLELYLDTKELSRRIDNKAGPGAASRVALGVFYRDQREIDAGVEQFHRVLESQFHPDGTWKETPVYGAKALFEGMAKIPELLRGKVDLYADPLYRKALEGFGRTCTPLGSQLALGDSPAEYCLQAYLADLARIRLGVTTPSDAPKLNGFNLLDAQRPSSNSGYVAGLECITPDTDQQRHPGDGPAGFPAVGHVHRRAGQPSVPSMFNEDRSESRNRPRPAINTYFEGRGLACMGWGEGSEAVQLYINGDDGLKKHRHADPLNLTLFAHGRELFPDLGYLADHPANAWVRSTAAHNTVAVNGASLRATDRGSLQGWGEGEHWRYCDLQVPVACDGDGPALERYRRAVLALRLADDSLALVDLFDVEGGDWADYLLRINDPQRHFTLPGLDLVPRREALFQEVETPPFDFRTAGRADAPFEARWGGDIQVRARVLSPCDEVICFQSPAWRNALEVFEDPTRGWDTLCLRRKGGRSRFLTVYEIAPRHKLRLLNVEVRQLTPGAELLLETAGCSWEIGLDEGRCRVQKRP